MPSVHVYRPTIASYHRYVASMARAISVRLDDEALRASSELEATGVSRSEAIRAALVIAASRLRNAALLTVLGLD